MRYRKLAIGDDYSFGGGPADFWKDVPQAVAQLVLTRLRLMTNEWFLDKTEGTPYAEQILGAGTGGKRDAAVQRRILETTGVKSILKYTSKVVGRKFSVSVLIDTIFGATNIEATIG